MVHFLGSYNLMTLVSYTDVVRIPATGEVEATVSETRREHDVLIRYLVILFAEEADLPFVRQEILDALDRIKAYIYNSEFRGTVMCLLNALSELCEVNDIKVLKGQEHDVHLRL